MKRVSDQTIGAIGSIGGTIREVSEIATAIAAAVEEQDAATSEMHALPRQRPPTPKASAPTWRQ